MFPTNSSNLYNPTVYPRLTTPTGTFLNNPSTAAAGQLGGPQVTNIPQISQGQSGRGSGSLLAAGFSDWLKNIFTPKYAKQPEFYNELHQPIAYKQTETFNGKSTTTYNPVAYDASGNRFTYDEGKQQYVRDETKAFSTPTPSTAQANNLVGKNIETSPQAIGTNAVSSIFPGKSFEQVKAIMEAKGYALQASGGHGPSVWVLQGESASSSQQASLTGRASEIGPNLGRGEFAKDIYGNGVVGGIPTTKDIGNTPAGTAQYALTVGSVNKKLDELGAYKWTSYTTKDENGNWVRVYQKQLRGAYTGNGGAEDAANKKKKPNRIDNQNYNNLVTLRANYG
jgi:hypothetical protein